MKGIISRIEACYIEFIIVIFYFILLFCRYFGNQVAQQCQCSVGIDAHAEPALSMLKDKIMISKAKVSDLASKAVKHFR